MPEDDRSRFHPTPSDRDDEVTRVQSTVWHAGRGMPERIGRYRVVGRLGVGGMGVVYEAEQENPKRRVALKLIKTEAAFDRRRVRLFEREVETLGRLKHPGIAAIYEAGQTDTGQNYFAMELVRGSTLERYLRQRPGLDAPGELEHRLSLFRTIVDAVHYAHQRGVIHLDLKPSNVLVDTGTEVSSDSLTAPRLPTAKILDFGLARLIDHDVQATLSADAGLIQGTLAYMSPEQTRSKPAEIDTRSDVYSLGVMLYELLSGQRPYYVSEMTLMEALRVICERPPEPLGRVLTERSGGRKRIDLDLETIVAKCLEKAAEQRYTSAAALSEDLGRFLSGQPILARPASTIYQLRKLAARNKPMVAGVLATAAALVLGIVVSTVLYLRAEASAARARTEASKAETVATLISDMLSGVGPSVALGRDTELLEEVLVRTSERVEKELADQPEVEAALRYTLGMTYSELGQYEAAMEHLERSLELRRAVLPAPSDEVARSLRAVGMVHYNRDELESAEQMLRQALELSRQVHDTAEWSSVQVDLANTLVEADRFDEEAEPLLRGALEARRGLDEDNGLAVNLNSLGLLLHYQGKLDEAEGFYREALEVHTRELPPTHPHLIADRHNLAALEQSRGNVRGAQQVFLEILDTQRELYPDGHPNLAVSLDTLGRMALDAGLLDEAELYLEEAMQMRLDHFGDENPDVARSLTSLARLYRTRGEYDKAVATARHSYDIYRATLGEDHLDTLGGVNTVAFELMSAEKLDEAREWFTRYLEGSARINGENHPDTLLGKTNLANLLLQQGKPGEAEPLLREVVPQSRAAFGEKHFRVGTALNYLALALLEGGADEEAVAAGREARDIYQATVGTEHGAARATAHTYALTLQGAGHHADAIQVLEGLLALPPLDGAPARASRRRMELGLAESYSILGDSAKAEELFVALASVANELKPKDLVLLRSLRAQHRLRVGGEDSNDARRELEGIVAELEAAYGPDSRRTRQAKRALEQVAAGGR